jgi:hypothetical protein
MTTFKCDRDQWLSLAELELLRQCRQETCRGRGPGSQKRNKTESAVRLLHLPSGIAAEDDASRSQHLNRRFALRKLRLEIALQVRCEFTGPVCGAVPGVNSEAFAGWVAVALDALAANGCRMADTAASLGLSSARLGKELAKHSAVWQVVNREREKLGLAQLRH